MRRPSGSGSRSCGEAGRDRPEVRGGQEALGVRLGDVGVRERIADPAGNRELEDQLVVVRHGVLRHQGREGQGVGVDLGARPALGHRHEDGVAEPPVELAEGDPAENPLLAQGPEEAVG